MFAQMWHNDRAGGSRCRCCFGSGIAIFLLTTFAACAVGSVGPGQSKPHLNVTVKEM